MDELPQDVVNHSCHHDAICQFDIQRQLLIDDIQYLIVDTQNQIYHQVIFVLTGQVGQAPQAVLPNCLARLLYHPSQHLQNAELAHPLQYYLLTLLAHVYHHNRQLSHELTLHLTYSIPTHYSLTIFKYIHKYLSQ